MECPFGGRALRPGETVLTLGSCGVSTFALQLAKIAGAQVISTSSDKAKLDRLRVLGAGDVVNYREVEDWDRSVRRLTGGRGGRVDLNRDRQRISGSSAGFLKLPIWGVMQ